MRWFRFYNDAMRHAKVAQLSDQHFRLWVELLCVASESDGRIPGDEALKTILRRRLDHLKGALSVLLKAGLIDALDDGYTPHGWDKRQYKSDSSTERSRSHREKCNVAATVDATPPETETDTEAEKIEAKASCPSGDEPDPDRVSLNEIVDGWNTLAEKQGLSKIVKLSDKRRRKAGLQARRFVVADWLCVFSKISQSPFLRGENDQGWQCDFDFILEENNFLKIMEGKYDRKSSGNSR